jgi:NAD(P)-dependent dehydrogenase (short-subunit alcohol dehydrogenase family)
MDLVALITGGGKDTNHIHVRTFPLIKLAASGMGLAVATSLAKKGWKVNIADLNAEAGEKAVKETGLSFFMTYISNYASLSGTFEKVFDQHGQINFVFANAGVGERKNFYSTSQDISAPPAELDFLIDIDLKSVINSAYLAQYYFRKSPKDSTRSLVLNASIAGLYPVRFCPIYTAAKHGVVGFAKAISKHFYENDGIRVNTLCPANVRTNLFEKKEWDVFDMEWIQLSQIVKIVELMLFNTDLQGKVIEAAPKNHYIIEPLTYRDANVKKTLEATLVNSLGK